MSFDREFWAKMRETLSRQEQERREREEAERRAREEEQRRLRAAEDRVRQRKAHRAAQIEKNPGTRTVGNPKGSNVGGSMVLPPTIPRISDLGVSKTESSREGMTPAAAPLRGPEPFPPPRASRGMYMPEKGLPATRYSKPARIDTAISRPDTPPPPVSLPPVSWAELERVRAETKVLVEESKARWRASLAEQHQAGARYAEERVRKRKEKDARILEAIAAGKTERAICRDLMTSPNRVVRLRALLGTRA